MDTTKPEITTVLMLPWLAHGHISPFLELAKKLSHKKFHIYFCSTPINLNPIRQNLDHQNSNNSFLFSSDSIQLIDLHLPHHSLPELPPHYHTTKDLPPHLMPTLKTAFDAAKPSFSSILHTLKPDLVIYDFIQPWVPVAANELNIPAIVFLSSSASTLSFLLHHCSENSTGTKYPFPGFDFPEAECQKLTQFMEDAANGMTTSERFLGCMAGSSGMVLIKTSRDIEDKYIDHLSVLAGKEVVPVGPLVQDHPMKSTDHVEAEIMEWLSKKEPSSTVFVSFGSEYFPPKAEIEEIALGLELSEVNFIWVVRFHGEERIQIHEALPKGFLGRVGEIGFVVENWAPQVKILGHESIGGFVSHCGWSSALEGMIFGVPIIAMPMQFDQPLNAKLVVDIGVGVEVQRQNIDEKLEREEVARVIREVMVQEQGEDVRRKAMELKGKMKMKGDGEIDAVVQKLIQLVAESNQC